jgi:hypothetical protein
MLDFAESDQLGLEYAGGEMAHNPVAQASSEPIVYIHRTPMLLETELVMPVDKLP